MYSQIAPLLLPPHALLHRLFHPRPPSRRGGRGSNCSGIKPKHRIVLLRDDAASCWPLVGGMAARRLRLVGEGDLSELVSEHGAHALETLLEIVDARRLPVPLQGFDEAHDLDAGKELVTIAYVSAFEVHGIVDEPGRGAAGGFRLAHIVDACRTG